jgi:GTP-binding protein YchF
MNIGIIGLPKAGKTTIFNALTGQNAEVAEYATGKVEPNVAVVDVGDPRVEELSRRYQPKKTIHATIEFIDFVGGGSAHAGAGAGGGGEGGESSSIFSGEGITLIRSADALLLVLRNFSTPALDEVYGSPDPTRDLESVEGELILSDQVIAERRLERIEADHARGKKTPASQAEQKVMRRVVEQLDAGGMVRDLELTGEEERLISGFRFLTAKPVLAVVNSSEETYGTNQALIDKLGGRHPTIEFAGSLEMELAGMEPDEAAAFLDDMGISESARDRLTHFAYRMLGYISFFTVGEDEVRAWTIREGENAQEAAGTIHSDLAKGFIRAECFTYDDLIEAGSEAAVKQKGLFRLEGKDYRVKDGDILNIRFNV